MASATGLEEKIITFASTVLAVFIGGWLTTWREHDKDRKGQISKKLELFYGPLLNLVIELRQRESAYLEIMSDLNELSQKHRDQDNTYLADLATDDSMALLRHRVERWQQIEVGLYEKILETYRNYLYLADAETAQKLVGVIKLIEIASMNPESRVKTMEIAERHANERELFSEFEEHLRGKCDQLTRQLSPTLFDKLRGTRSSNQKRIAPKQ